MVRAHSRRAAEFIPLSKAVGAADDQISPLEPLRMSKASPILIDANLVQVGKRSGDFAKSPGCFVRAVRILMMAYALVPSKGPVDATRCSLEAAQAHLSTVEHFSRINITHNRALRHRILECEMTARQDWNRIAQQNPGSSFRRLSRLQRNGSMSGSYRQSFVTLLDHRRRK